MDDLESTWFFIKGTQIFQCASAFWILSILGSSLHMPGESLWWIFDVAAFLKWMISPTFEDEE